MIRTILLFLAALPLVSCIGEDAGGSAPEGPARTVLVWLGGDNDLTGEVAQKIEALRRGWRPTGGACLIYADSRRDGARLLRLRGGCAAAPEPYVETVAEYGPENSASAEVFGRVLRDVTAAYPADGYGLVFFSHGSGWLPAATLRKAAGEAGSASASPASRSLGRDDSVPEGGSAEMELADFAGAIPDGALDFILFESCFSAGVEVAYALRHKARYLLVSSAEMLSPGFAPVYPTALPLLFDASRPTADALAAFGRAYMDYINTLDGAFRSATLSLVDTSYMDVLAARIRELLGNSSHRADISIGLQHFDRPGSYGDIPAVPRFFDFGQWAGRIAGDEVNAVFGEQMKRTVIWEESTERFLPSQNGFEIRCHSGLTVYVEQPELVKLNEYYRRTAWYGAVWGGN